MIVFWELYPFLVFFFLIEGLLFVRKGMNLFILGRLGRFHRVAEAGLQYRGFDLFTYSFYNYVDRLLFTYSGFYYLKNQWMRDIPFSALNEYDYCDFNKIKKMQIDGSNLKINDQITLRAKSPRIALSMYEKITKLTKKSQILPEDIYESSFSLLSVRTRLEEIHDSTRLVFYFQVVFLINLIIVPPLWFFSGVTNYYLTFAYFSSIILIWIGGVITYAKCSKKLNGKTDWLNTFQLIVYPISLCRSIWYLTKDALIEYDEIAIAGCIFDKNKFLSFARPKYELLIACTDLELPTELYQMLLHKKKLFEAVAETKRIQIPELSVSPIENDPNTICFCPVCLAEYRMELDFCKTCSNVKTRKKMTSNGSKDEIF